MNGKTTAHSTVEASPRAKVFAGALVIFYAVVTMVPLLWILLTGFKTQ
jgi:multiple sugar transport system permease protein